jgi:hypothetical protein
VEELIIEALEDGPHAVVARKLAAGEAVDLSELLRRVWIELGDRKSNHHED